MVVRNGLITGSTRVTGHRVTTVGHRGQATDTELGDHHEGGVAMNIAILLLILALLVGGVGLFVEALRWMLIVAVVLALISAFSRRR